MADDEHTYFCVGCESTMEDEDGKYSNRYSKWETCPLCMTNEELWVMEHGTPSQKEYFRITGEILN